MNKKPTLNVLSIDFDFFQTVDAKTVVNCYPDGIDLPPQITTFTWAGHYTGTCGKQVNNITCPTQDIDTVLDCIKSNAEHVLTCEAYCSHVHIFDMIFDHYDIHNYENIHILNLDMHHDFQNDNTELDCGNWLSHVKRDCPNAKIQWITRPTALELYNLTEPNLPIHTDLKILKDFQPDLIFVCRSDTWFPPHLDPYFDTFIKELQALFPDNCYIEPCVQTPRNFALIQQQFDQLKSLQQHYTKKEK